MQQVQDFLEESEILYDVLQNLDSRGFDRKTQFKNWTIDDVLVHLHFWNLGADLALNNPDAFKVMFDALFDALKSGKLREYENEKISQRGAELLDIWITQTRDMASRWQNIDPKTRVKWAGPDMSVRTSMSARQMEVWAHGQAIFDALGSERAESDRISNIVVLGVNAFGWSHKVHGLPIPETSPKLNLTSPSGNFWEYGHGADTIEGTAVEFCQVVTQTRNIADTSLVVSGADAARWMEHAQCFAGPPETPPAPGERFKT